MFLVMENQKFNVQNKQITTSTSSKEGASLNEVPSRHLHFPVLCRLPHG